ncbi:MAG TPA: hypothetical protein VMH41_13065 [Mycobacteriales bacterium]|nr:hypothetical protein [Mycobacteriales bacterium]
MTDPAVTPQWHQCQPVSADRSAPTVDSPSIDWPREGVVALVVTAFSLVIGAGIGLIWPKVAPHVALAPAVNGSEAAAKALLGADMWFALLAIAAGVLAVAGLVVTDRRGVGGPGAVVGLAVGGVLGSLVAAQVGHRVEVGRTTATLHRLFPSISAHSVAVIEGYFGFSLRMRSMIVVWPLTAVILHGVVVALRSWREGRTTLAP